MNIGVPAYSSNSISFANGVNAAMAIGQNGRFSQATVSVVAPQNIVQNNNDAPRIPGETSSTGEQLTEAEQRQIEELKQRDREVRAHEQAHKSVGGPYASAPSYTYTVGPDGKRYAVGGEVKIDVSPERSPEATIQKMEVVIRAALAPAEPSAQDRAVARQAQATRAEAQGQLAEERAASIRGEEDEESVDAVAAFGDDEAAQNNIASIGAIASQLFSGATDRGLQAQRAYGIA